MCGSTTATSRKPSWIWPPSRSAVAGAAPLYGMWVMSTLAICRKSSPARCDDEPGAVRPEVELSGLAAGELDQVLNGGDGHRRVDHQHVLVVHEQHDRDEVLEEVVVELGDVVHRPGLADAVGSSREVDHVAVRSTLRHDLGPDVARSAGAVVDDDRLAEELLHLLGDGARFDVGTAAGREPHDETHRMGRVRAGLGERNGHERRAEEGEERLDHLHDSCAGVGDVASAAVTAGSGPQQTREMRACGAAAGWRALGLLEVMGACCHGGRRLRFFSRRSVIRYWCRVAG